MVLARWTLRFETKMLQMEMVTNFYFASLFYEAYYTAFLVLPTDSYDTFLFDCDGVLWRGSDLLPGSTRTLALLRAQGKRLFFVTNNSSKSRAEYVAKFTKLNIPVDISEIVPSSWAAAEYVRIQYPEVKKAFVIGSQGLVDELNLVGVTSLCGADQSYATRCFATESDFLSAEIDKDVTAVLCGWDLTFNFAKLSLASLYLQRKPTAAFIATNKDAFDKLADRNIPGNGCAVAALEQSVGREAVDVGKPSRWLINYLLRTYNLNPRRTLVIGDRLDTDIQLGIAGGCDTVLVGTGCTTTEDALLEQEARKVGMPTYVLSHVGAFSLSAIPSKN